MKFRRLTVLTTAAVLGLTLAACADNGEGSGSQGSSQTRSDDGRDMLETHGPEAIADADGSGLDVSARFFESADALVVSADSVAAQRRAAEEAISRSVPMVEFTGENSDAILAEAERLGADTVVTVGEVPGLVTEGTDITVENIPVDAAQAPAQEGETGVETPPAAPDEDPAAGEHPIDQGTAVDLETSPDEAQNEAHSAREQLVADVAGMAAGGEDHPVALPPIFVTEESSAASVATAKAAGGDVHLLDYPDPRITTESMELAAVGDTLALGGQFGDSAHYAEVVSLADNGELPGGGGLAFPGRRMVALYGHPSGEALGLMGEQPPAEAAARVEELVAQYQPLEEQPVIPAFEIIVTVASGDPGDDGNYSNEFPVEDYVSYIDAITEAGGYAVLDLQSGRATFLDQAKLYEELLKRPNVGLAIDPEWRIGPDEMPMQRIGNTTAEEVNEVSQWLADLTADNNLPQKVFIVHQFQSGMIEGRENVDTSHPELAFVLHADGHGTPDLKFGTWNVLQQGLVGEWFMAWKNFIDEDTPTFSPEQTYTEVDPRPWFVSYQ